MVDKPDYATSKKIRAKISEIIFLLGIENIKLINSWKFLLYIFIYIYCGFNIIANSFLFLWITKWLNRDVHYLSSVKISPGECAVEWNFIIRWVDKFYLPKLLRKHIIIIKLFFCNRRSHFFELIAFYFRKLPNDFVDNQIYQLSSFPFHVYPIRYLRKNKVKREAMGW